MSNRSWRSWLLQLRHPSDEELLALIDGELPSRKVRKLRRHLQNCWACRVRADKAEAAIARFMEHRLVHFASDDGTLPPDWSGFSSRLARASVEPLPGRKPVYARFTAAEWASAGLIAALVVVVWWRFAAVPVASAKEILARAVTAEHIMAGQSPDPVFHGRLRIIRRQAGRRQQDTARVDWWRHLASGRAETQGGEPLWAEVNQALRADGEAEIPPVSADGFAKWWAAAGNVESVAEAVTLLDGSRGIEIRVRRVTPAPDNRIVENRFVVREDVWRPVQQRFWVRRAGGLVEYDLFAEEYRVVAFSGVSERFGHKAAGVSPRPPGMLTPPEISATRSPVTSREALLSAEVQVHFALHRLDVCLGEPVEVERDPQAGVILVKGLVSDDDRRRQLTASLGLIEHVKVRLETMAEASQRASEAVAQNPVGIVTSEAQVRNRTLPIERLLPMSGRNLVELSNTALGSSGSALLHAWALQRLGLAFPAESVAQMKPATAWLVEVMAQAHAAEIEVQVKRLRDVLHPLFSPFPQFETIQPVTPTHRSDSWRMEAPSLITGLRDADSLVRTLFTVSGAPSENTYETASRLWRIVANNASQAHRVQQQVSADFPGAVAGRSVRSRGKP